MFKKSDSSYNYNSESSTLSTTSSDYIECIFKLKKGRIPAFVRNVFCSILQEAINQLTIIKDINRNGEDSKQTIVVYKTPQERFFEDASSVDDRTAPIASDASLAETVNMIVIIFKNVLNQISSYGSFKTLTKCIMALMQMRKDDLEILNTFEETNLRIQKLQATYENERLSFMRTLKKVNVNIKIKNLEVQDYEYFNAKEQRYFNAWEASRIEQNNMKNEEIENTYKNGIEKLLKKKDNENRIHSEIMQYLEESKNDYAEGIQYWLESYDEDMDQKEKELINKHIKYDKLKEQHLQLQLDYKECVDFVKVINERKKAIKERQALLILCVTKIQTWWREVMKQRKLGPYRRKKSKPKKGKKKKIKNLSSKT